MPPEVPVNYPALPTENVVPVPAELKLTSEDLQKLILDAVREAIQNAKATPQPGVTPWKSLLSSLAQPRMVGLVVLIGCELFTRVTHIVVPPDTVQNLIDLAAMLLTANVMYKSQPNSII